MRRVYLDANAISPPCEEARLAMADALEFAWGNPSSIHGDGRKARARVEDAREAVAALMHVDPRDILFTSGGTEANNIALRSLMRPGRALITSRLEHPSIVKVAESFLAEGRTVQFADILPTGEVDEEHLLSLLRATPDACIALQAVNSETGVVQPLGAIGKLAGELGAEIHVDAIQAWGRIEFDTTQATTMSLAAHKVRGPKGIGVLSKTPCTTLTSVLFGGSQERGVRPGTLDAALAAGLAAACKRAALRLADAQRLGALRDRLEQGLLDAFPGAVVNGKDAKQRVAHVTNISFGSENGPELVAALDLEGISVSSGSACSAGTADPSPVITAIGGKARSISAVRFSLGDWVTEADIDFVLEKARNVLARAK